MNVWWWLVDFVSLRFAGVCARGGLGPTVMDFGEGGAESVSLEQALFWNTHLPRLGSRM